jgi:pilus assembly protein CpaB
MVHLVRDANRDIPETVTRTILQDIKVFAVNDVVGLENEKDAGNKSITAKTISLLVTPDQAAKLMLAAQLGTVNLVMRSPEDDQQAPVAQARPGELLGATAKSERSKESLTSEPAETNNLNDRAKGFLEFLAKMKAKATASVQTKSHATWTMRVLKPGAVDEVLFEAEDAKIGWASPFGLWKISATAAKPAPVQPAVEQPKAADQPSGGEPSAAADPQPKKGESTDGSRESGS